VRIRAIGPASVDYDTGAREITLYPGNVERMTWVARSFFTAFGQALRPDGRPVANAAVQSPNGIGETDDNGYFQIDVAAGEMLSFDSGAAGSCQANVGTPKTRKDLVALGKVVCR
jgi:outer membrane usher protein FimD/PapC